MASGGQVFFGYPAGAVTCVYSVTPASGPALMECPILRWRGDIGSVPRDGLPAGPLRCSVAPSMEAEVVHLGAEPVAIHYRLDMTELPAARSQVEQWDTPPDWVRPYWHALWRDHVGRGVETEAEAEEQAQREFANPRLRWFTIDRSAAACSLSVQGSHLALISAYVAPEHRGQRLQRQLIQARLEDGWRIGHRLAITKVAIPGEASSHNLEAMGWRAYGIVHVIR